jgi:hypothetical protein
MVFPARRQLLDRPIYGDNQDPAFLLSHTASLLHNLMAICRESPPLTSRTDWSGMADTKTVLAGVSRLRDRAAKSKICPDGTVPQSGPNEILNLEETGLGP